MKTLTSCAWVWMGAIFLLLTACKNDDEAITPTQRLTGLWNLQSSDIEITINGQNYVSFIRQIPGLSDTEKALAIVYVQGLLQEFEIDQGATFAFRADNQYEVKIPGETPKTGTWMLSEDGSMLTLSVAFLQDDDLQALLFDVETLTDIALILTTALENKDDFDADGAEDTLAATLVLHLSK